MVVYNAKIMLIIKSWHVHTNYIWWSYWDVMMYHLVLWLCLLEHKTCSAIFYAIFNIIIYINPINRFTCQEFFFSIPTWLMWSWSSTCAFSTSGIIACLSFMMILSITAMPSLHDQYILMSSRTWSLISSHPVMMYPLSCCKCSSWLVTCCICVIDLHSGMFIDVSTLTSMPCISSSLFSIWLCLDSQSAIKSSGPGLHIILTQYWCIYRRMCWIHCDRVAMSFLNIATRDLWSVIILAFWNIAKQ